MNDSRDLGRGRAARAAPGGHVRATLPAGLVRGLMGTTGAGSRVTDVQRLKASVHRVSLNGVSPRSVIVKRLDPVVGHRNEMVLRRWLPLVGMQQAGPRLLRTVAEPTGRSVWHVYEDLGETSLDGDAIEPDQIERSAALVAALHLRFADHALLGECRLWGGDLGMAFRHANVVDGIRAIQALLHPPVELRPEHRSACEALLTTLRRMLDDEDRLRRLLAEHDGRETLLHGDLWRKNVLLADAEDGRARPCLIDWDHAAVGPISYDLSTLLSRFTVRQRPVVLDAYRAGVAAGGWRLPEAAILNGLFVAAEETRIANRVIWPAIQIRFHGAPSWALDQLVEVEAWFRRLEPILP